MLIDKLLKANEQFLKENKGQPLEPKTEQSLAIISCMDARLVGLLERSLNVASGEAVFLKNAGNTVTDNSISNDVIRSLVSAVFLIGCKEILVVGHSDCKMAGIDESKLRQNMFGLGIDDKIWGETVPVHGLLIEIASGRIDFLLTV